MPPRSLPRFARLARVAAPWLVYGAGAWALADYLNAKADLAPRRGLWYSPHPFVELQVRAFLSGKLALLAHPSGAGHDWDWGRGGMHQAWGLGLPILAIPFHFVARWLGAPAFPDNLLFLLSYAATSVVLARALHRTARGEPAALVPSTLAAAFVMTFPTFVGMVSSRFLIYEETIAMGALWSILLLAGVLFLFDRCTPARLTVLCAAAGFSLLIRPPLAIYGAVTVLAGLLIAYGRGARPRVLVRGLVAYAGVSALYLAGNALRFGSIFNAGYENCTSGPFVNRLARWGLSFAKVPLWTAAKEMFATLFLLQPVASQIMMGTPPPAVAPYVAGERWREYYSPTFDLTILAVWLVSVAVVAARVVRRRPWRLRRDLADDLPVLVGAWGLLPAVVLFFFYARLGNMVTRYATDMFPAFAAAGLCVGMVVVGAVRQRAPALVGSAQLAVAAAVVTYIASWHPGVAHLSQPTTRAAFAARIAQTEGQSAPVTGVPSHFKCGQPRGPSPVDGHLGDWHPDCTFASGMVFAMPHSPCVAFTFRPAGSSWGAADEASLAAFQATGDSDRLVACGPPVQATDARIVTVCEPHRPSYLLDGMRLYSVATLDANLDPIDRLKLMQIDAAPSCP